MANEFETLLKTDTEPNIEIESETAAKLLNISKRKVKRICVNLCLESAKYDPVKSMNSIEDFLKSKSKLERILYSELSSYIFGLTVEQRGIFATNVEKLLLYSMSDSNQFDGDCNKIVIKIYDHFHLALHQIENVQNILTESVAEAKDSVKKEVKGVQKEYITILGIFSSVILAFVGGITFSSSVLQNIDAISIYRLLMVIDLLAIVLINSIYVLVKFIMHINDKGEPLFKIGKTNIIMGIIAGLIIIALAIDARALFDFLNSFLPWIK